MLQNATLLRKSAPGPPNSSDEDVSCTAPATENTSLQILFKCPTPAIVIETTKPSPFAHFWHGAQSLEPATRYDIWASKSGPSMWCSSHFGFEMCFTPQRCALFRDLNFQKCSEREVFSAFNLQMCFSPQRRAIFSSIIWPHGWAPAVLASLLFDPLQPQIIGKHSVSRLSYLFAHLDLLSSETFSFLIFFLLLFSFLTLPVSAFHLSILSEVWLLNVLRWKITINKKLWFKVRCHFLSLSYWSYYCWWFMFDSYELAIIGIQISLSQS